MWFWCLHKPRSAASEPRLSDAVSFKYTLPRHFYTTQIEFVISTWNEEEVFGKDSNQEKSRQSLNWGPNLI